MGCVCVCVCMYVCLCVLEGLGFRGKGLGFRFKGVGASEATARDLPGQMRREE